MYEPESIFRRAEFSIEHQGIQYTCERIATGKGVLHQKIYVVGVGCQEDVMPYGPQHYPPETMPGTAYVIAQDIIHTSWRKRQQGEKGAVGRNATAIRGERMAVVW
jgi:hypothetical protein